MRHPGLKQAALGLFNLVNLFGAGWAVVYREGMHATVHVVLLACGIYTFQRLTGRGTKAFASETPLRDSRLDNLQQSIDVIAVEVERIGEAQRFHTKLEQERAASRG